MPLRSSYWKNHPTEHPCLCQGEKSKGAIKINVKGDIQKLIMKRHDLYWLGGTGKLMHKPQYFKAEEKEMSVGGNLNLVAFMQYLQNSTLGMQA